MRAWTPSETTSAALVAKSAGICAWYVWSCWKADQTVAFSSAGFFSSITASGRPFTNSTTSGRRVCCPSATVNWLTASQSLLSGASKSITRACAPAIDPSLRRYSTVTPSTSSRCIARLRSTSDGASERVSLR